MVASNSINTRNKITNLSSKILLTHWTWIWILTGLQTTTCLQ